MIVYDTQTRAFYYAHSLGLNLSKLDSSLSDAEQRFKDYKNRIVFFLGGAADAMTVDDFKETIEQSRRDRFELSRRATRAGFRVIQAFPYFSGIKTSTFFNPQDGRLFFKESHEAGIRMEQVEKILAGSATAGLEERVLAKTMVDSEALAGLEQQGWARVPGGFVAEADLSTTEPLVLQKNLKPPVGLPKSVSIISADETTVVGMVRHLSGLAFQGGYNVAFSTEYFDLKDAQAAVPLTRPMPGSVLLAPGTLIRANELGAAFVISKRTGTIYVVRIVEFTSPNWKKPLLYLRVQA